MLKREAVHICLGRAQDLRFLPLAMKYVYKLWGILLTDHV